MKINYRKLIVVTLISSFVVMILAGCFLSPYFYMFHGSLSTTQSDWGDFGAYLSGTIGTLFSFIIIITMQITLIIQSMSMQDARKLADHNIKNIEDSYKERQRQELIEFTKHVDAELHRILDSKTEFRPINLCKHEYYIKDYFVDINKKYIPHGDESDSIYFRDLSLSVKQLLGALCNLKSHSDLFYNYYNEKNNNVIKILIEKKYIEV